jgi:glutaredoxin
MLHRLKVVSSISVTFLIVGLLLLFTTTWASAGSSVDDAVGRVARTITPTPADGTCLINSETPCAPGAENNAYQSGGITIPGKVDISKPSSAQHPVAIYMFWGDGCPHCAVAKPFLQELAGSSDRVDLRLYEVWYVEENQELFTKMAASFGFEPQGVPTIFIGKKYWIGYDEQIKSEIQAAVNTCLKNGCPDPGVGIIPGVVSPENNPAGEPDQAAAGQEDRKIEIPLIGTVDLEGQSLLISTLLISFVDGFNACSIWVLTMLLALTLHTGSRKKVLLIGLIFLTVTAAIYGLFITGLFTMFKVVSFVGWIQVIVALVALFFALVNIKDYFWYKEGISFTISDDHKPGIFQRIRRLMDASQSFWGLVGGTVVLAAGVSLVEFSCTAGLPILWSNILVSQNVPVLTFVLLLLVYLLIYQLDELGIFFAAVFSMRASKLEEKHGRILKLIGGVLMLSLAVVMLVDPGLMNNLSSSMIIFGAAFVVTILILLVHRVILPKFGILVGTEFRTQGVKRQRH